MSGGTLALTLAAAFTFGCITIHESRQHAKSMTPILGTVALCLGVLVGMIGLASLQPSVGGGAGIASAKNGAFTLPSSATPRRPGLQPENAASNHRCGSPACN